MSAKIDAYRFGHIVIDGTSHHRDVIILPDRVIDEWWREEGHSLHPKDLGIVFEAAPEVLVVGQDAYGLMQITREVELALHDAGIELAAQPTGQAVETYNRLCDERAVAAALHLTC